MTTGRQPAATAEKKRADTQLSPAGERQKVDVAISCAIRSTSELFTAQRQTYASLRPATLALVLLEGAPPMASCALRNPAARDWLRIAFSPSWSALVVHGLPCNEDGTIGLTITSLIWPLTAEASATSFASTVLMSAQALTGRRAPKPARALKHARVRERGRAGNSQSGAIAQRMARPVQHTSSAPAKWSSVVRCSACGSPGERYSLADARFAWYGISKVHAATADELGPCDGNCLYRPALPQLNAAPSGCMRDSAEQHGRTRATPRFQKQAVGDWGDLRMGAIVVAAHEVKESFQRCSKR